MHIDVCDRLCVYYVSIYMVQRRWAHPHPMGDGEPTPPRWAWVPVSPPPHVVVVVGSCFTPVDVVLGSLLPPPWMYVCMYIYICMYVCTYVSM